MQSESKTASLLFEIIDIYLMVVPNSQQKGAFIMEIAKVFKNGRSQAVRIPKRFRFKTDQVSIRRKGDSIILTPVKAPIWDEYFATHTCPDFELDRSEAQKLQHREFFQ